MKKNSVVVGMSGGVDSSVSAYLLKKAGYNVTGLFMHNWQSEPGEVCSSEIDFKDASSVCDVLDIPLHKANFSDDYWNKVFKKFLEEHEAGRTPNPDILCNREIKFKSFLNYAISIGANYIATGHYANLKKINDVTYLTRAKDLNKDQTYFLHEVKENELDKCIFPLHKYSKNEVRKIAKRIKLPIFNKKDSVGICFIGERNMKDFLGRFINLSKGDIYDDKKQLIGQHNGATLYTIGQRQGLKIGGIKNKKHLPWYVYKKDITKNEIYVCQGSDNILLYAKGLVCNKISWINNSSINYPYTCDVQIRHQQKPVKCTIKNKNNSYIVDFEKKIKGVAPGQSAVFYDKNICLGGGIISKSL